jgi:hypothetical protein
VYLSAASFKDKKERDIRFFQGDAKVAKPKALVDSEESNSAPVTFAKSAS